MSRIRECCNSSGISVFKWHRKVDTDGAEVTSSGKLFQTLAPASSNRKGTTADSWQAEGRNIMLIRWCSVLVYQFSTLNCAKWPLHIKIYPHKSILAWFLMHSGDWWGVPTKVLISSYWLLTLHLKSNQFMFVPKCTKVLGEIHAGSFYDTVLTFSIRSRSHTDARSARYTMPLALF